MGKKSGVFISHKEEDRQIALSLKTALEHLSQFKMEIFVCEEIPGGADWRKEIEENIANSKIMIFLYTEDKADWSWCLYELGLFRGKKKSLGCRTLCIKRDKIDLPSPLQDLQAYDANESGIKKLIDYLVFDKSLFGEILNDELYKEMQKTYDYYVKKIFSCFVPPMSTENCSLRMGITLSEAKGNDIKVFALNDGDVLGKDATMTFLDLPPEGCKWSKLYDVFKKRGQYVWLDQLATTIDQIKSGTKPNFVMQPFISQKGDNIVPVISSIEKFRGKGDNEQDTFVPKRIYIIFVPVPKDSGSASTLQNMEEIFKKWNTYPPSSVVKIMWKKRSGGGLKYDQANDVKEEPFVCKINSTFADLFDFKYESFRDMGNLTCERLVARLIESKYVEPEHLKKLVDDQNQITKEIVFENKDRIASIPLQFKDNHPFYPNESYLPYLVCKHVEGDIKGEHATYLLICYIKYFCPLGHQQGT